MEAKGTVLFALYINKEYGIISLKGAKLCLGKLEIKAQQNATM